jgi:prevent-host-death family protein
MDIPLSEAKTRLTELARRAQNGEDVVLTRHGQPAVRLVAVTSTRDRASRRRALERISRDGAANVLDGATAARSQDFLYDDDGLPREGKPR